MELSVNIYTPYIVLGATLIALMVLLFSWRVRSLIPSRERMLLLALRLLAIVIFTLIALNPYYIEELPAPNGFRVPILADVSGSMHLPDTEGKRPRVDVVASALDHNDVDNFRSRMTEKYDLDVQGFSDRLFSGNLNNFDLQSGVTALGDSLNGLLSVQSSNMRPIGGVILFSDGISLRGESVFEVAKRYKQANIPITVVGVGETGVGGDLEVSFVSAPDEAVLGEPFTLSVKVDNKFTESIKTKVSILEGKEVLQTQEIAIGQHGEGDLEFSITPRRHGLHIYRAKITDPFHRDLNPTSDVDYASVDVSEPDVLKILYLGSRMSQYYRFLKMAVKKESIFELRAVIKLAKGKYYRDGFKVKDEDQKADGFPLTIDELLENSVLVVDTSLFLDAEETILDGLKDFLVYRGGGLLVIGQLGIVPEEFRSILPARNVESVYVKSRQVVEVIPEPVFHDVAGGSLFTPPAPFVEAQNRIYAIKTVSAGARSLLESRAGGLPLVVMQAYGAGRVVYMGSEVSWRWRMDSDRGLEQHGIYWRNMLTWLGTGGKPRIKSHLHGAIRALDEPLDLGILVRDKAFRLSENATVKATVRMPNGVNMPEQNLTPAILEPGRYEGLSLLGDSGEYQVKYAIDFNDGEHMEQNVFFAGEFTGLENSDLRFRQNDLKDIARITGGEYFHYKDISDITEINLSSKIPMIQESHYWTRHLLFFLVFLCVLGSEWILRRRMGLK